MALVRGTARDKRGGSKHERKKRQRVVGVVDRETTGTRRDGKTKKAERNG